MVICCGPDAAVRAILDTTIPPKGNQVTMNQASAAPTSKDDEAVGTSSSLRESPLLPSSSVKKENLSPAPSTAFTTAASTTNATPDNTMTTMSSDGDAIVVVASDTNKTAEKEPIADDAPRPPSYSSSVPSLISTTRNSTSSDVSSLLLPPPTGRTARRRGGSSGFQNMTQQREREHRQSFMSRRVLEPDGGGGGVGDEAATTATKSGGGDFRVHSIRRGSQEWRQLVKPFVADLAFSSVVSRHFARKPLVRPYTCEAAVLFVDISGYSKIAAALQDGGGGAHALSSAVNGYLSRLLRIVQQYGGDVVKFAGDAVLCVWHTQHQKDDKDNKKNTVHETQRFNVLSAARCAMAMQEREGSYPVDGTNHVFRIHIGLSCGIIESEIFVAPVHNHMQRMYHLVGGPAVVEIGDLVDLAKAGQVAVSADCVRYLRYKDGDGDDDAIKTIFQPINVPDEIDELFDEEDQDLDEDEREGDPQILVELKVLSEELSTELDVFVEETMIDRLHRRVGCNEEDFIHPSVLDLLSHGGLSPTQIAQMRDLVVLFIAQTSHGSPGNWLMEVQSILDRNQCPLLQIVTDDKGVHAIAAVNASLCVPESRLLGIEICRQLVHQQIGVAIGMAAGITFCGVTGSSHVSCRWDITGGPPVRAARLMQYALKNQVPMAIDETVYVGQVVPARMTLLAENIPIKGSPDPIRIFTLSEATEFAAMSLLESVHGEMHNEQVQAITKHITGARNRSALVVTGPTLSGKKIVCQRAAGYANMVPYLHVSDSSYGMLQLGRTIATWYQYASDEGVRNRAKHVLKLLQKQLFSRAHDECLALIDDAMNAALDACFVVDRVEFLDDYSVSLMRECLYGHKYREALTRGGHNKQSHVTDFSSSFSVHGDGDTGRIAFLCVHVALYNQATAESIASDIRRSHRSLSVPVIEVGEATLQQFKEMADTMTGAHFDNRVIYVGSAAAGHCAGFYIERASGIGQQSIARAKEGKRPLIELTEDLTYRIPRGSLREFRHVPVMQIGPEIAMRYAHVYDELPPMMQVFCKVLAVVSETGFYWAPQERVWEVLNDLVAEGVDDDVMSILLKEMSSMYLVQLWNEDGVDYVKFQSPGLADIAMDVCTPVQIRSIAEAWIERLMPDLGTDFRLPLVLAWLHHMIDPCGKSKQHARQSKQFWKQGYDEMVIASKESNWNEDRLDRWKELIVSEVEAGSANAREVLGLGCEYGKFDNNNTVSIDMLGIWQYRGPVGLGPLGTTLSVIAERIMEEVLLFVDGGTEEKRKECDRRIESATKRYVKEVEIVEELLSQHGLGLEASNLEKEERAIMEQIGTPAKEKSQVFVKAKLLMSQVIDIYVASRLERLYALSEILLQETEVPTFVKNAKCYAIFKAYHVMFEHWKNCLTQGSEVDLAQHVLMILATRGWQPREPPETLRHLKRQTVARLRNAVVRKLTHGQLFLLKHQQGPRDLKAFLITTALLFDAQDSRRYNVA